VYVYLSNFIHLNNIIVHFLVSIKLIKLIYSFYCCKTSKYKIKINKKRTHFMYFNIHHNS
ncbi:unnamed protein product, partial [Heterotrigona itama]